MTEGEEIMREFKLAAEEAAERVDNNRYSEEDVQLLAAYVATRDLDGEPQDV